MNSAVVVMVVLAAGLPFLAGGAYVVYRAVTQDEPEPAVHSAATRTRVPVVVGDQLEKYRKRLIGRWETDMESNGVTRRINIEFKADGT